MSTAYQREFQKVLKLAKNIKDESTFQKHTVYRKFKAKNLELGKHQLTIDLDSLIGVLNHAKFYNEKIFWCQKILQHCRLNLHWQRCRLNGTITLCYFSLKDDEKCLEYGEKCLGCFDNLYDTDYIKKEKR